jgi:hypothetical protein
MTLWKPEVATCLGAFSTARASPCLLSSTAHHFFLLLHFMQLVLLAWKGEATSMEEQKGKSQHGKKDVTVRSS